MIITRSPLRISFAGGGTDIPAFYKSYGPGIVVSTSINKHVYVSACRKFDKKVSVRYRQHEMKEKVKDLNHVLIRNTLLHYGIEDNIELVISSDVPAKGSGLGASSAMIVALCLALEKMTGKSDSVIASFNSVMGKRYLAETASEIEIEKCGSPIGKQDQYASAAGGFNRLVFNSNGTVNVDPYPRDEFIDELEGQSMLFYLNIEHTYFDSRAGKDLPDKMFAPTILYDQLSEIPEKNKIHTLQRDNALRMWEHMEYAVIERFMDHVNENWRLKRTVHRDISNEIIDKYVEKAYAAGATAAKVCGAGGGGFLYLMTPPSMQGLVREALNDLHELHFKFDQKGAECIFEEKEEHAVRQG